jgi:hypothetical protein
MLSPYASHKLLGVLMAVFFTFRHDSGKLKIVYKNVYWTLREGTGMCFGTRLADSYLLATPLIRFSELLFPRDSSVGIALGYGLDCWVSRVRFPAVTGNSSLRRVQNGSGAHSASYPVGTGGSFPGGKVAGA